MTRIPAVFCLCAAVAAQAQIGVPRAGCVLDRTGSLRPLYGLPAILMPGTGVESGAISAACSDRLALVKTGSALEVRDTELRLVARWPAPPGAARLAVSADGSVAAYFEQTRELVAIEGAGSPPRPLGHALHGEVLAIASTGGQELDAVVLAGGSAQLVRISLANGQIERYTELPHVTGGPVMLLTDGTLVYGDGAKLAIRKPRGEEQRFALAAPAVSIYAMGDQLAGVALAGGMGTLALRLEPGRERLFRVPEAAR
jgi:hypothetical protein